MHILVMIRALNSKLISHKWLIEIGIQSVDELREFGVIDAYLAVKSREPRATLNVLWEYVGLLDECRWNEIPKARKIAILEQMDQHEAH